MPTLKELRQNYPDYNDMSDQEFSDSFYSKFYSDMDRKEFDKALGIGQTGGNTALGYGKTIASAIPKAITNTIGGGMAGAATVGLMDSPRVASEYARTHTTGTLLPLFGGKTKPPQGDKPSALPSVPNPGWLTDRATKALGLHTPETPGEQITDAATQMGVSGLLGGGATSRLIPSAAINTAAGAASEYARQKTEGVKVPEWVPGIGGKDISPAVSAVTAMFTPPFAAKKITPSKINPVKQQQYETAVRESGGRFTPTAGQLTGDQAQINAELATNKGKAVEQQQKDAFMETATGPTGDPNINVTSRNPDSWVARNMRRTGDNIDNLERTTHIQHPTGNIPLGTGANAMAFPDFANIAMRRPQDVPDILKIIEQTTGRIPAKTAAKGEEIHNALFNSNGTGRLTGEQYKRLRTNLHSAAEGASNETAHSYRQTANALDNAMSATNPEWGRNWHQARREYANTLVMQEAAKKPGVTQFTPDQLDAATKAVMGKSPHLKGELENSPFIDAAAAFKPLKKRAVPEEPSMIAKAASYVPGGRLAMQWLPAIGGVAGHLAGQHLGWAGGEGLIAGTLLGAEARKRVNVPQSPYMNAMSPISQWHKKNQIATTPNYSPGTAGMLERAAPSVYRGSLDVQRQNNQQP